MTRNPHGGEMEYCERCGQKVELSEVEVSEAGEFTCPACGLAQYVSDEDD